MRLVKGRLATLTPGTFFLENGFLSFRIYGEEITENTAKQKIEKMKEITKCL